MQKRQQETEETECKKKRREEEEKESVLLQANKNRFVLYPIIHSKIWEMYKKHEASFWTAEEIELSQDMKDWEAMTPNERHFFEHVIAFFAASDGIILENLAVRFLQEVQLPEARCFYGFQMAMENIHSETYSLLIDTYIKDPVRKNQLFHAMDNLPCVKEKADWALRWMNSSNSFTERLVAFAVVEGIFFSGSFCAIFWAKKRSLLPGLAFANELISRDEGLHCDFACLLYTKYLKKLKDEIVFNIVREAIEIEEKFICVAVPVELIGMNKKLMSQYIQFVGDRLLVALGHDKIFNVCNPFEWMELISLQGKTNFFEKRVGEYQKAGVMRTPNSDDIFKKNNSSSCTTSAATVFTTEADF